MTGKGDNRTGGHGRDAPIAHVPSHHPAVSHGRHAYRASRIRDKLRLAGSIIADCQAKAWDCPRYPQGVSGKYVSQYPNRTITDAISASAPIAISARRPVRSSLNIHQYPRGVWYGSQGPQREVIGLPLAELSSRLTLHSAAGVPIPPRVLRRIGGHVTQTRDCVAATYMRGGLAHD